MRTRIIGIDPGLNHTGWGIIESEGSSLRYIACGTLSPQASLSMPERLLALSGGLQEVLRHYQPATAGMEETFVNKNALTSLKLGQARGALLVTLAAAELAVGEYSPRQVKQSVTGTGKAEKAQIHMMIKHLLPGAAPDSEDAADALAVAICHSAFCRQLVSV